MDQLLSKYKRLIEIIKSYQRCVVAFSGGVDSTLLAYAAYEALKNQAIAITAIGAMMADFEVLDAAEMRQVIGIAHQTFKVDIAHIPFFNENGKDRCYHCKKSIFIKLKEEADHLGIQVIVDGSNTDDAGDYRPGKRALAELGIKSPLVEADLNKNEIRRLSEHFGLKTHDKPNFACLASRIPYGEVITADKLKQIDLAEQFLRQEGFKQFRVRHHGKVARIELEPDEMSKMMDCEYMKKISSQMKAMGFSYVALDLDGYHTGSMNRELI